MSEFLGTAFNSASEISKKTAEKTEQIILSQLGDLVKRGLIVIESTQPVLIHNPDSHLFHIKQSVRLVPKEKEYIERLEKECAVLRERLALIKKAINSPVF